MVAAVERTVRELGFADWFAAIYIDALDEPNRRGKHGFFQDILSAHGLRPDEVLVVGDNPDSEIEAGNRRGMQTT
jgi:FMN phosphatase YigB (HAD superfamily)